VRGWVDREAGWARPVAGDGRELGPARLLQVVHRTRFLYEGPVRRSVTETRLAPADDAAQRVERFEVVSDPPGRRLVHRDGFGAEVTTFFVESPHHRLEIRSESLVMVRPRSAPPAGDWREVGEGSDWAALWLLPTARTDPPECAREAALRIRRDARTPRAFVEAAGAWLKERVRYEPGATHVGSSLADVFAAGAGVCQDFAHALVAILRAGGVPARYVSGYLLSAPDRRERGGHAWVEALLDGVTWCGYDPVHGCWEDSAHLRVAAGRDYDDVVPVRGVYEGPPEHELQVEVQVVARPG
jgi:transglutaminase-like putative cysteine protease